MRNYVNSLPKYSTAITAVAGWEPGCDVPCTCAYPDENMPVQAVNLSVALRLNIPVSGDIGAKIE